MTLGVDLGGSSVKVVSLDGEIVEPLLRVPHGARGLDALVLLLADVIRRSESARIAREEPVGLAVAGLVRGRSVLRSGNLALADAPLAERLEALLGRRLAAFVSDAHATGRAALGEEGTEPVVIALALGTGVGGAVIERAGGVPRIVRDEGLGHGTLVAEPAAAPCALGHASCLEAHLGAAALARAGSAASVLELDGRAEAGDAAARSVLEAAGALAGRALAPLARGERARLVLSGGVASSRAIIEGARTTFPGVVVSSRFGSSTAAAGAALAARS